jgi:probable addiction module antidote protein
MPLETSKWDVTEYLDSEEAIFAYIEAAFEDGDTAVITHALGNVARARGMTSIAKEAGVTREALYKALTEKGDPKLSTFLGVLKALGISLSAKPTGKTKYKTRLSA